MIALSNVTLSRGHFVPLSAGLISCILPEERQERGVGKKCAYKKIVFSIACNETNIFLYRQ